MEAIIPYINFKNNAKEALAFYSKALNGQVLFSQTYGESPMESKPEDKDKIMHATFKAGDLTLMVSDANDKFPVQDGNKISLSMNFKDDESITKTYNALAEGGNAIMPLQDTFWGAKFGMLIDKFGVQWMFNYDKPKDS